jgi:hypothetical protein
MAQKNLRLAILFAVVILLGISSFALAAVNSAADPCDAAKPQLYNVLRKSLDDQIKADLTSQIKQVYATLDSKQIKIKSSVDIKDVTFRVKFSSILANKHKFEVDDHIGGQTLSGAVEFRGHEIRNTLGRPVAWHCEISAEDSDPYVDLKLDHKKIGSLKLGKPIAKFVNYPIVD